MKDRLRQFGPLAGLLLVLLMFSLLRPAIFPTASNFQLMLVQTAVVGTAALGMTMIIISGGIDLSVGSVIALSTVIIALLLNAGFPPWAAAAGAVVVGALCGGLIGNLVTRLRLLPFIVTLGMWGAIRGAAKGLANESVVSAESTWLNGLLNTPEDAGVLGFLPAGVWLMIVLAGLVAFFLRYAQRGRHIVAVGSSEQTARLCGVPVGGTKIMVYVLGGIFAALAGVLQFSYLTVGDPTTASGMELDVIAAVVIGGGSLAGGEGSVAGSLVGALIMTAVANGCTKLEFPNWVQEIVTGGIIVASVSIDRFRHRVAD